MFYYFTKTGEFTICFLHYTANNQLIETLEEAYKQVQHLPSPPVYSSICHMLALQYMDSFPLKAAFYLAESIAVTFRHQSLVNASRKIRYRKWIKLTTIRFKI